jgi:hypothetical protein
MGNKWTSSAIVPRVRNDGSLQRCPKYVSYLCCGVTGGKRTPDNLRLSRPPVARLSPSEQKLRQIASYAPAGNTRTLATPPVSSRPSRSRHDSSNQDPQDGPSRYDAQAIKRFGN